MDLALAQARDAAERGEVPVGAVLIGPDGNVLAANGNRIQETNDATAHAEMLVLREGARLLGGHRLRLTDCDLYVTLEPCAMCASAIALARIRRLYFGAYDVKGGGVENGPRIFSQPTCNHRPEVYGGIAEVASGELLKTFFAERRR